MVGLIEEDGCLAELLVNGIGEFSSQHSSQNGLRNGLNIRCVLTYSIETLAWAWL
jgi:hypothetical protein